MHHCHLFCGLPRTSGAPHGAPVDLFERNIGLLGPWELVGEGGNRPSGEDWQGDYGLREQRPGVTRWGVRGRRISGFTGTRGEMVTWGSGRIGGAEEV